MALTNIQLMHMQFYAGKMKQVGKSAYKAALWPILSIGFHKTPVCPFLFDIWGQGLCKHPSSLRMNNYNILLASREFDIGSNSSFINQPTIGTLDLTSLDDKGNAGNNTGCRESASEDCAWEEWVELGPVHETVACADVMTAPIKDREVTFDRVFFS